jgi:LPS sulfotransferase NodH
MPPARNLFYPRPRENVHLEAIEQHFGALERAPADLPPDVKFVFLCYTNRSGSNYVAALLASDLKLPMAGENLNFNTVIDVSREKGLTGFHQFFEYLVRLKARNGYFALKVAPAHLELLARSGILDQIISRSYFIEIERADKLGQAISLALAFQTGRFTSEMEGHDDAVRFDRSELQHIITAITEDHRKFGAFFGQNGIVPAHLIYEHVVKFPVRSLTYATSCLGLPDLRVDPRKVTLRRQAGPVNERWRRLFLNIPLPVRAPAGAEMGSN